MQEIQPESASEYVTDRGLAVPPVHVEPLAWGVSNVVLMITGGDGDRFVLKQSRTQLRTADPWFSRLDRIFREIGMLRLLSTILPAGVVPRVRFEDRENYLFTMDAAPENHVVWKHSLLAGQADPAVARQLGTILGTVHRQTAFNEELRSQWGDAEVFVQLRVDPFYRRIAEVHADLRPAVQQMVDGMFATPVSIVLADFSPKNVLVHSGGLTLVDFETGHYGDPAFDLGFFLSHLLLKTVRHAERFDEYAGLTTAFWPAYWSALGEIERRPAFARSELHRRTLGHLAGCLLARIDGTSKIDYLTFPEQQSTVRSFARGLFLEGAATWDAVLSRLSALLGLQR